MITLNYLQAPSVEWNIKLPKSKLYPRHWKTLDDMNITLSDGRKILIKKDSIWDGASIPRWLWWLFKPIDKAAIGDRIHDYLWKNQVNEIIHFGSIFEARKFADEERERWRCAIAPEKKYKNKITAFIIRKIGGLFYSRQIKIPN